MVDQAAAPTIPGLSKVPANALKAGGKGRGPEEGGQENQFQALLANANSRKNTADETPEDTAEAALIDASKTEIVATLPDAVDVNAITNPHPVRGTHGRHLGLGTDDVAAEPATQPDVKPGKGKGLSMTEPGKRAEAPGQQVSEAARSPDGDVHEVLALLKAARTHGNHEAEQADPTTATPGDAVAAVPDATVPNAEVGLPGQGADPASWILNGIAASHARNAKATQAEGSSENLVIRATRADGKGMAETIKLGGEATDKGAPAVAKAARTDDGADLKMPTDGSAKDHDVLPVLGKGQKQSAGDDQPIRVADIQVLEARRFVGLADGSNAVRLGDAIGSELSGITPASTAGLDDLAGNVTTVVHTLKLQMNPEDLGPMTANLRLKGDDLTVDVRVETVEAFRQLTLDQDSLIKSLQDQGFSVEQVNIQLAPSASSDSGSNAGSQQGQSFQAPGRENAAAGGQQGGQQGNPSDGRSPRAQQNGLEQGLTHGKDSVVDLPDTARGERSRPSQLYV